MKNNNKEYRINDTVMNEQEFKNIVFSTGKVVSVKESSALISALKNGEYVIGVGYNPFCLLRAYHYANGELKEYCFEDGEHPEPLNLKLVATIEVQIPLKALVQFLFSQYDDCLINPTKDMLNLDDLQKDVDYSADEYCAYGIPAYKRNCETCSMTHYFHDCNGNPIHSKDDE